MTVRRPRRILGLLAFGLGLSVAGGASAQDFDPHGRHHPQPPPGPAPGPGPGPRPGPSPVPVPAPGATPAALIDRYTRALLTAPYGAGLPLQRLPQLYRDRDGNIAKLIADFEQRAADTSDKGKQYGATIALAAFYKSDGRSPDAIHMYETAIGLMPADATAVLLLAHMLQDRGDSAPARQRYEQALPLQTSTVDKEQTLRTLMELSLDLKDWDGAGRYHVQLVKLDPTSMFVKAELGRELFARGEYARSEMELKSVVAAATGDNRALAPALKELGRAQAMAKENKDALDTLNRALAVAGPDPSLRADIYDVITEVYRAEQQLPVLVKQLENEHPGDYSRLALLGALYEETGDSVKAIETYRKALAISPRQIDLRVKMIRLLQANGDLEAAVTEYDGLIRAAPNNPDFVFEECDALLQRGDRARAMKLLTDLEARESQDEDVLNRVADYYGRIGENDRALAVLKHLADVSTSDASHLVDLGDRYYQDGNQRLAVQTWQRILAMITPRAKALAAIGEVYLEHDMTAEALASFKESVALDPSNDDYKKALAGAYERTRDYGRARTLYVELFEKGKQSNNNTLLRECRSHIVTLWSLEHVLDDQIAGLSAKLAATPPDVESGRLLAEVYQHLRKIPEAEATLRRVIQLAPGDTESYLALERVLVSQNKLADAIAILEKLAQVDKRQERQVYQRMATYALQIYSDEDAIKYAARAVELNPEDAEGHRRLAEMYKAKGDNEHAIAEFRAAIMKNERDWLVYFELADLLLSKGQAEDADRLFRRVVRSAPDDELVARAARLSMQINLGKGTLEQLEQDLLPLAISMPQKPIYRRLLVEIYGNMTFGLVQRVRHGHGKDRDDARAALAKIGGRAVKPLLDALADQDVGQQRVAIDVLGYVENKNAALPLFSYATGTADAQLRMRAMTACGALRDANLLPKFEALLFPKEGDGGGEADGASSDVVAVAATWSVAKLGDAKAVPLLRRLTNAGAPQTRALAVLGLGLAHDRGSIADVSAIARAVDSGNVARAAAAYTLGELGADGEAPTLLTLGEGTDSLPREMALIALARLGQARAGNASAAGLGSSLDAMADSIFAGADQDSSRSRQSAVALQSAGLGALSMLAGAHTTAVAESLPVPDGTVDVEAMIGALLPTGFSDEERAAAFTRYAAPLQRAALGALQTSGDGARAVLDALGSGDGEFEPFLAKSGGPPESPSIAAARAKARDVAKALEPSIIPLARHPDPSIRTKAIVLLSHSASDAAIAAVVQGVDDSNEAVKRVALAAIGQQANGRAVASVGKLLETHDNWSMRVLAAEAMGRLGAAGSGADAVRFLREAALKDSYALVREAALQALAAYDKASGQQLASQMAANDAEPRVRETAQRIARP